MSKAICSQVAKANGSETMAKASTFEVEGKRRASLADDEIVRSRVKARAVQAIMDANTEKTEDGCWIWKGGASHGYGELRLHPGEWPMYAHRVAYALAYGPIQEGLLVCHHCDNPRCVRPDHLFMGTQKDNLQDMARKKRSCLGEKNRQMKLSDKQVEEIRRASGSGVLQKDLVEMYGVSPAQISRIVRGRRRPTASGTIKNQHGNYIHGHYARRRSNDLA